MEIAIIVAIALVAIGVVIMPLVRGSKTIAGVPLSEEAIDEQVAQYRAALRSGTICERCLAANPPGSRFCSDCGQPL